MTFQFLCPQGHLLQGEEEHMGMQCECPQCGMAFIIPTVEHSGYAPQPNATGGADPALDLAPLPETDPIPELAPMPDMLGSPEHVAAAGAQQGQSVRQMDFNEPGVADLDDVAASESLLHIPCPNGHELETPLDMIGQRAKCPHCGVEFRLRREKSIEFIYQQGVIDRKRARFWMQAAIVAACIVVFSLVIMMAVMLAS
jgi:hypothetical protein